MKGLLGFGKTASCSAPIVRDGQHPLTTRLNCAQTRRTQPRHQEPYIARRYARYGEKLMSKNSQNCHVARNQETGDLRLPRPAPKERGLKLAARSLGLSFRVLRRARQPCPGIQSIHRPSWGTTRDGGLVLMFFNRCEAFKAESFCRVLLGKQPKGCAVLAD
jgi:hypothetical protein